MKVELIAYTPNPVAVCAIGAGTCTSEEIPEGGAVTIRKDEIPKPVKALKHAIESGHESVLEHASFTFAVSGVSRALTHQLVRHRLASFSQQSQRYVLMDQFDYVVPESIRSNSDALEDYTHLMETINAFYLDYIDPNDGYGIDPEDARYILPNACCTNIIVTMNARELRHFFNLRCCNRAQWEIRELANRMLALCKEVAPDLFDDAGPSCVATGRCPEKKSCGRMKIDVRLRPFYQRASDYGMQGPEEDGYS